MIQALGQFAVPMLFCSFTNRYVEIQENTAPQKT